MIKQVAGRKIQTGNPSQGAGALVKPNLASQDLIAQFSKLVEEISAQMELINSDNEGRSRSNQSDSPQDRSRLAGAPGVSPLSHDSIVGLSAGSSKFTSKERGDVGQLRGGDSEESSINESREPEPSANSKGLDVGSKKEKDLSELSAKKANLGEKNGNGSDSQMSSERDDNSKALIEDSAEKSSDQPSSLSDSNSQLASQDASSGGITLDSQSAPLEAATERFEIAAASSDPNTPVQKLSGRDPHPQMLGDSPKQMGNTQDQVVGRGDQVELEQAVAGATSGEAAPGSGADDGAGSVMGLGGSGVASQPEVQQFRGDKGVASAKGGAEGHELGLEGQDEQLLGALREQAGQRIQGTAANNQKLAKAIFERLTGDNGRGDAGIRALDAATGANSSSALLGDTLGKLAQGEKFLPRKERVALSQGVQLRTMERIEQALKEVERSKDGKSISIRLDPPNLGHVRTDITLNDGVLYARFVPESREIGQVLRERASELQSILKRAGFDADRVQISVSSGSQNEQGTGLNSSFDGQGAGDQLFQRQGYQGEGSSDSGKDGWRERGFEQNIKLGAGKASAKTDDHWVA